LSCTVCPVCHVCLSEKLVYCGQRLDGSRCHLVRRYIGIDDIVSPYTERGTAAPTFRPMSTVAKRSPISGTAELLLFIVFFSLLWPPCVADAVITGSIARSASRLYLIYSEADFEVFRPQGRHVAPMRGRPLLHTKFHPIGAMFTA